MLYMLYISYITDIIELLKSTRHVGLPFHCDKVMKLADNICLVKRLFISKSINSSITATLGNI